MGLVSLPERIELERWGGGGRVVRVGEMKRNLDLKGLA